MAAAFALLLAAACGGAGTTDPISPPALTVADVAGTYVLTSVGGHGAPFPYSVYLTPGSLLADTTTYRADGTWSEVRVYVLVGSDSIRRSGINATWQLDAAKSSVVMVVPGSGSAANYSLLTLQIHDRGRTLTVADSYNGEYVYTRLP